MGQGRPNEKYNFKLICPFTQLKCEEQSNSHIKFLNAYNVLKCSICAEKCFSPKNSAILHLAEILASYCAKVAVATWWWSSDITQVENWKNFDYVAKIYSNVQKCSPH